ncbi:MAG: FecR domain-containing protein [Spirochaetes bacterium]|nr:FecR domain-containing protein [Spirochaetota bacterium]
MKKTSFVLLLICAIGTCYCKKAEEEAIISIIYAIGEVKIFSNGKEVNSSPGTRVNQSDRIVTGKSSSVDLNYLNKGVIHIGESSDVTIELLIANKLEEIAKTNMNKGRLIVSLSKLRKNSSFEIKSSTAVAAIRGTTLKVISDGTMSKVYVVKGKVNVTPINEGMVLLNSETTVEENYAVEIKKEEISEIQAGKKQLVAIQIPATEMMEIQKEVKEFSANIIDKETVPSNIKEIIPEIPRIETEQKNNEREKVSLPKAAKSHKRDDQRQDAPGTKNDTPAESITQPKTRKTGTIPIVPNL